MPRGSSESISHTRQQGLIPGLRRQRIVTTWRNTDSQGMVQMQHKHFTTVVITFITAIVRVLHRRIMAIMPDNKWAPRVSR